MDRLSLSYLGPLPFGHARFNLVLDDKPRRVSDSRPPLVVEHTYYCALCLGVPGDYDNHIYRTWVIYSITYSESDSRQNFLEPFTCDGHCERARYLCCIDGQPVEPFQPSLIYYYFVLQSPRAHLYIASRAASQCVRAEPDVAPRHNDVIIPRISRVSTCLCSSRGNNHVPHHLSTPLWESSAPSVCTAS
jgi:hypothetical protein